jgi:hypothetical protein
MNSEEKFVPEIEEADLADFCQKLVDLHDSMQENPVQQQLLNNIVKLAWVASQDEDKLMSAFDLSFSPKQAALILDYPSAQGQVDLIPHLFRGFIR